MDGCWFRAFYFVLFYFLAYWRYFDDLLFVSTKSVCVLYCIMLYWFGLFSSPLLFFVSSTSETAHCFLLCI